MPIIAPIPRNERRQMQKNARKVRDKGYFRRITAIIMLSKGQTVIQVAEVLDAARSSIGRWIKNFTHYGIAGLISQKSGRCQYSHAKTVISLLKHLIRLSPQDVGYLRTRWSTEILTIEINKLFEIKIHKTTLHRWLSQAGIVWRRAAPTLKFNDPHYEEKMASIVQTIRSFTRMR